MEKVDTKKLDYEFNNLLHERLFIQKRAEYRAGQIRKDVNMLASVSVNGATLMAFYILSTILFEKIYSITGGTSIL